MSNLISINGNLLDLSKLYRIGEIVVHYYSLQTKHVINFQFTLYFLNHKDFTVSISPHNLAVENGEHPYQAMEHYQKQTWQEYEREARRLIDKLLTKISIAWAKSLVEYPRLEFDSPDYTLYT